MMESVILNNPTYDWLESQLHQQVAIWCEDPETNTEKMGFLDKTYLTYRILYKQMGRDLIAVRHRYSEFESLRNDLRDRYHPLGILVPSLPPKNVIQSLSARNYTNTDGSAFVKERTLGLTLFCENVVVSPWLRNDPQWKAFCLPQSTGNVTTDESTTANNAETQLVACLKQLEFPPKFPLNQRIEEIREEVKTMEGHARYLLEKSRAIQSAEATLQNATDQMKKGLEGWYDAERIRVKNLGGKTFEDYEPVVCSNEAIINSIVGLTGVINVRRNTGEDVPNYIGLTLSALFEYELANIEALKELLKVHDEMVKDIESTNLKIAKLESSKAVKLDQLQEAKRSLEDKQACVAAFYKGFMYFTIPFISRQRASHARRFFSGFICSQMSNSYTLFKACQEYFTNLVLPVQQVAEETSRMLDLLKVKPIAKLPFDELDPGVVTDLNSANNNAISPSSAKLKSRNIFMSYETDGLIGLFDRALQISKQKPTEKKPSVPVAPPTTHLFTSSIASINAPNRSTSPLPAPKDSTPKEVTPPPAAAEPEKPKKQLSARFSSPEKEREKEVLPRFVEGGSTAPATVTSASNNKAIDLNEEEGNFMSSNFDANRPISSKSQNILDSLLGDSGNTSAPTKTETRTTSVRKNQGLWEDD